MDTDIPGFDRDLFNYEIEDFVVKSRQSYIEAVVEYAEKNGVDIEIISKMLNTVIKQKIEFEANERNLLKESFCTLPI